MKRYLALTVASLLLIVLPVAGLVAVGYGGFKYATPQGVDCGLWVLPALLIGVVGGVVGFLGGLGIGWAAALGLIRWANAGKTAD